MIQTERFPIFVSKNATMKETITCASYALREKFPDLLRKREKDKEKVITARLISIEPGKVVYEIAWAIEE